MNYSRFNIQQMMLNGYAHNILNIYVQIDKSYLKPFLDHSFLFPIELWIPSKEVMRNSVSLLTGRILVWLKILEVWNVL